MQLPSEIQNVIRLLMLLKKQKGFKGFKSEEGGLMVVLWNSHDTASYQRTDVPGGPQQTDVVYGSVAAAGPWLTGVAKVELKPELLQKLFPSNGPCPEPDPEELCSFTDMHGPLHFLISFQVKDGRHFDQEGLSHVEAFLHNLSLTNARVKIHFSFKSYQETRRRIFSVKMQRKITLKDQWSTYLDVASYTKPSVSVEERPWCQRGHPVIGESLSLSIPPEAMEGGLYGELSLQPVTLLTPCVLQYPNLATRLTRIQVLTYNPSNVPVASPSEFLNLLPVHLDCEELGLSSLQSSTFTDLLYTSATILAEDQGNCSEAEQGRSLASVEQSLLLFLFLQHSDPFTSELSDVVATEELLEQHLEAILTNNRKAVTAALQRALKNTLNSHRQRSKASEKMCSAFDVILSSALSIVSSSSNFDFRNACLNNMRVNDTHELSAAFRKALMRMTSWKFVPKGRCHSAQDTFSCKNVHTRKEN